MTEAETPPTFRLIYRSHSRIPTDDRRTVLAQIFDVARANNKRAQVTGALLVTDHYFVQALEGDETRVRSLFDRISRDERHDQVTVVAEDAPGSRVFSRWAMARVSADGRGDIPLHTTDGAIHRAAPTAVTRDQAAVLKRMRNSIGADAV